ncbi:MAG: glutamate--tRNA ligase [Vampirovibrio sp.]|nr:glutamate--tRNA ligase [Vampirovibrio sp.]
MSDASNPNVRVRIAPSPTGNLHVGTARTALFNWLYARHTGGTYVLRVEDTDFDRSHDQYVENIFEGLKALELDWDEGPGTENAYGPYHQKDRLPIYKEWVEKLIEADLGYYCYCTNEEIEAERNAAIAAKRPYVYSGRCRNPEKAEALKADPVRQPAVRFKVSPDQSTLVIEDEVRGQVSFDPKLIGDFIIFKANGTPTYNFAVVVDDILMKITHIIRGEDHISNTPKQMMIYDALDKVGMANAQLPVYAHVGMILAHDRTKLSKRHGATAVSDIIAKGYLPEAFCNFLALLGWSPPDAQEVKTLDEIAMEFSLDRLAQSPAIYDTAKLDWLNGLYIRNMDLLQLLERSKPYLKDFDLTRYSEDKLLFLLDAVREPLTVLSELPEHVGFFFTDGITPDSALASEVFGAPEAAEALGKFNSEFVATTDFSNPETLAEQFKAFSKSMKPLKGKALMWPIRLALTGQTHGADLTKTIYILGKETVSSRVEQAMSRMSQSSATV